MSSDLVSVGTKRKINESCTERSSDVLFVGANFHREATNFKAGLNMDGPEPNFTDLTRSWENGDCSLNYWRIRISLLTQDATFVSLD